MATTEATTTITMMVITTVADTRRVGMAADTREVTMAAVIQVADTMAAAAEEEEEEEAMVEGVEDVDWSRFKPEKCTLSSTYNAYRMTCSKMPHATRCCLSWPRGGKTS